jgi:hypothetical protein
MIPGAPTLTRIAAVMFAFALFAGSNGASAQQQSCSEDFQKLAAKRMEAIQTLNNLGKAGKGKMDPMAACPAAKKLLGTETEMLNYMSKNKEWCNIPDPVIENFKQARTKSQGFASQACAVAAKMKEAQEQGAQGGMAPPPRLPAGPL